jgi:hypothetical protein
MCLLLLYGCLKKVVWFRTKGREGKEKKKDTKGGIRIVFRAMVKFVREKVKYLAIIFNHYTQFFFFFPFSQKSRSWTPIGNNNKIG